MLQVQSPSPPLHQPRDDAAGPTRPHFFTRQSSSRSFSFKSRSETKSAKKKMAAHEQYVLKVTAGPEYDFATHHTVNVNSDKSVHISTPDLDADIDVRIQKYRGLPENSPNTTAYFSHPKHVSDLYSISFSFTPKRDISGADMLFGNDFDHPVRDRLPPGFSYAFRLVKWMIDPGLEGDPYADEPYLYGSLLGSINILRVGEKPYEEKVGDGAQDPERDGEVLSEGADGNGVDARKESGMPDDPSGRRKYFLDDTRRKAFVFEAGRRYCCDFFNPYLDFNEFTLRLPGFSLPIIKHWGGDSLRNHSLRYVLRDRATNQLLFCVVFTLIPTDEAVEENKRQKEQDATTAQASTPPATPPEPTEGTTDPELD